MKTKPKVLSLAHRALQDLALVYLVALVMVVCCCVTNHPNTQWLKTAMTYVAHASVSGQGLTGKAYPCSSGVSGGSSSRARRFKSKTAHSCCWQFGAGSSGSSAGVENWGVFVPLHQLFRLPHSLIPES